MSNNGCPIKAIQDKVQGLDLWQPRDWPHRRGDKICLDLHSMPLKPGSPGHRSVACENCGGGALVIHDNVLCWKCKAALCVTCTTAPICGFQNLLTKSPDQIVQGWSKCPKCTEPLRAVALIEVFRPIIEGSFRNGKKSSGSTVVQEAEDALSRGMAKMDTNKDQAIMEFTHAINAINYFASTTDGCQLLLRPKDILLTAHGMRALSEGQDELHDAILAAFPKASVRIPKGRGQNDQKVPANEKVWYVSESGFKALFYPLPAIFMATKGHGLISADARSQSARIAFGDKDFQSQVDLVGKGDATVQEMKAICSADWSKDITFLSLNGQRNGFMCCHSSSRQAPPAGGFATHDKLAIGSFTQTILFFPTALAASESARLQHDKLVSDHGNQAGHNSDAVAKVCHLLQAFGVIKGVKHVHVYASYPGGAMCTCAVHNVFVNFCISAMTPDECDNGLWTIVAKAIAYLSRQLVKYRSEDAVNLTVAPPFLPPDPDLCSYCGKESSTKMHCSRCKTVWYCSKNCQTLHWQMQGNFSHKQMCKLMANPPSSDPKPAAIPLGRRVRIHGLQSAAGQRLNGKHAIVVTRPNEKGRVGIVLVDDVSDEEALRLGRGNVSWVPHSLQKSVKAVNLEVTLTPVSFSDVGGPDFCLVGGL